MQATAEQSHDDRTPVSRGTWEITPREEQSKLAVIHEGLDLDSDLGRSVRDGWTQIISAMKTYLEKVDALVATRH